MTDHGEIDSVSGTVHDRPRVGRHQGTEHAAAALVADHLLLCIIWAFGYWIVYPAWPLLCEHTRRASCITPSRADVAVELADLEKIRGDKMAALGAASLADIEKDPALLALARARGKTVFGDNCAPCHGSGAAGAKGYPNLNDDDWLWGGTLDQIAQTIRYGARSGNPKAHEGQMLAFGKEGVLKPDQIVTVANYVRSLSGLPTRPGFDAAAGKKIFAENCVACHGEDGKGNPELGAPNLTDQIWLYGSGRGRRSSRPLPMAVPA